LLGSLIKSLILERKEFEGRRFLGIFNQNHLRILEEYLKTDFGSHKRKSRPFVGYYFGKWFYVCLLTTLERDQTKRVDLNLCDKKGCNFNFQKTSYIFYDRKNKGFYLYQLPKDLIKGYSFCGYCKDLEHIDKLQAI